MSRTTTCLLTILLISLLSGCTNLPSRTRIEQTTPVTPAPTKQLQEQTHHTLKQDLRTLLQEHEYPAAVTLAGQARHNNGHGQDLDPEFVAAMNGVLSAAENLLDRGDYGGAGRLFKLAQTQYPPEMELQRQLTHRPEELKTRLGFCSEELIEAGLAAYRAGELGSSLTFWEQVLAFDPDNLTAQNALKTTTQQLENLQTIEKQ